MLIAAKESGRRGAKAGRRGAKAGLTWDVEMLRCSHVGRGRRLAIGVGGEARGTTATFTTSRGEGGGGEGGEVGADKHTEGMGKGSEREQSYAGWLFKASTRSHLVIQPANAECRSALACVTGQSEPLPLIHPQVKL